MSGAFEIEMHFEGDGGNAIDPSQFEDFLDAVMDELEKLGFDADYSAVASTATAVWTIDVEDGSEGALIGALTGLSTALAAVGVETEDGAVRGSHEVTSTRRLALA